MLKRNCFFFFALLAIAFTVGCASFSIVKENPSSPSLSGYKTIYVGWLDLREDDWKLYGFASKEKWVATIKWANISALQEEFKKDLPEKTITGASSKSDTFPGNSDLYLKFTLNKIEQNFNYCWGGVDKLLVDVEVIEGKTGKAVYTASIVATQNAPFPKGHGGWSFEARLGIELYNLARCIAEKLK
jgi:hypothetical protein